MGERRAQMSQVAGILVGGFFALPGTENEAGGEFNNAAVVYSQDCLSSLFM